MGRAKAEVRMATAHAIGVRMDDLLEGARAELERMRGARSAIGHAARKLEEHLQVVDHEAEEGALDPEQLALAKRYVDRCGGIVRNLVAATEVQLLVVQGKIAGLQSSVGEVKKAHDQARAKLEALDQDEDQAASETVERAIAGNGRAPGEHPGDPLADRRAEAQPASGRSRKSKSKGKQQDGANA